MLERPGVGEGRDEAAGGWLCISLLSECYLELCVMSLCGLIWAFSLMMALEPSDSYLEDLGFKD